MANERFIHEVRQALNHLYDPQQLEGNALARWFQISERNDTALTLQKMLCDVIDTLKPDSHIPDNARPWRVYEILLYRYVQQFSQQEVAEQLGLSVRHLRREHQIAIETIASVLEAKLPLDSAPLELAVGSSTSLAAGVVSDRSESLPWHVGRSISPRAMGELIRDELAWMRESPPMQPFEFARMMDDVIALSRPLAQQHRVRLQIHPPCEHIRPLAVHPVGLRQSLLSILSKTITAVPGGMVEVSVHLSEMNVCVQIQYAPAKSSARQSPHCAEINLSEINLDVAQQLASFCGIGLAATQAADEMLGVSLTIPTGAQVNVMVIEDNPDTIQLLQRYVTGTRYHLQGVSKVDSVFRVADELRPQLIVLDVMMPEIDGWDMLGRLQQHPHTEHIPVIVCTILAQRELALALGARDFIQKPVDQTTFRAVLDRVIEQVEKAVR